MCIYDIILQRDLSYQMQHICELYNDLNMLLLFILTFVTWMLYRALARYTEVQKPIALVENTVL